MPEKAFSVCIKDSVFIDPACGSGSLLIRAADEAPFEIAIWGQEKEVTTAGLAKMNLVLHNKAAGEISAGNTFSSPHYFEDGTDDEVLKHFDFAVANPPFSLKNWTDGLKDYQANMSNQGFPAFSPFINYLTSEAFHRHYVQLPPPAFHQIQHRKTAFLPLRQ